MRYIIEAKAVGAQESLEAFVAREKGLKMIDSYEPLERLSKDVEKLGIAMREYKNGMSWDVLNYYLRGKGLSQNMIDAVTGELSQFFKKVGIME